MDTQNEQNSTPEAEPAGKKVRAFFEKTVAGPHGTFPAGSTVEINIADFKAWESIGSVSRAK
jgi:hypothetical protein